MTLETSKRTWPISRLGVLADDLHIHVLANFIQQFTEAAGEAEEVQRLWKWLWKPTGTVAKVRSWEALIYCAGFLDYSLKDDAVNVGEKVLAFDWLGYTVVNGVTHLPERKLLATLLVPECFIWEDFAGMQSMRAIGISFTARDPYRLLSGLFFAFCARTATTSMIEELEVLTSH